MDSINIRTLIVYTQRMYIEYRKKNRKKKKASYRNRTDDHRITNAML
jgi:hypothetical protein